MKKSLIIAFGLLSILEIFGQDFRYAAALIPDSLKEDAFAVIRFEETTYEVLSLNKTRTKMVHAITILNDNGKKQAWDQFYYDKDRKITSIKLKVYNSIGLLQDSWNKKDFDDVSYDPYGTTFTDNRILVAKPISNNYPFTVEYTITFESNNTFFTKGWYVGYYDNVAVEESNFTFIYPEGFEYNLIEKNFDNKITKSIGENRVDWSAKGYKATKREALLPYKETIVPHVKVSAKTFAYNDYQGELNDWNSFGEFISDLGRDRDVLDEDKIAEIKSIADTCYTTKSKIKNLYEYMQSQTRYISIQVGIGGWQPFPASVVAETGYGDCKALSNYMMTILKYAGIKSYYTLVKAGAYNYYFDKDFVNNQFNHAILCVPVENDTVWLECTSQTMPCGYLGTFTDNREVLLITENGGVLTKTPEYSKSKNRIERKANVLLDINGSCSANLTSKYTGLEYYDKHKLVVEDDETQSKMLQRYFDIPNFKLENFNIETVKSKAPILKEEVNLYLASYASKSGTRLFLPLNLASRWTYVPKETSSRTFDIHKKYASSYFDTITYELPDSYKIEIMPEISKIDNKYGAYHANVKAEGNIIIYVRKLEINKGIFPAEEYDDYMSFFKQIQRNDGSMVVLKKL